MDRRLTSVIIALVAILIIFLLVGLIGGIINPSLKLQEVGLMRFVFTLVGLIIAFLIYLFTRSSGAWDVGTREVVYMAIGAALYAVLSYLFNGTVFVVPSVSQVALRPAIAIPMFFGYAFGPVVGFFTGAVGNMFGDALTGFGLYPQWSVGNGLVGMIAGMVTLFVDRKKSLNTVLIVSVVVTALVTALFFLNREEINQVVYPFDQPVSLLAGISSVIGLVIVVIIRFVFGQNVEVAAAVTWSALGNFIGIGFASIADIWVNGYSPVTAVVGEFVPAAGPNLIFAAILVPILVAAYASVQRQAGR